MSKVTFSLHKLEGLLSKYNFSRPLIEKEINSFYHINAPRPEYIKPTLSSENTDGIKEDVLPKVIIVSAAGATGKSELTKYLSATFNMPIFDLASHAPVASNSLTGLFYDTLGPHGLASYIAGLQEGTAAMIIDAIDEGYLKTTVAAYEAFLDGIISIASSAKGTPFILLGRSNIVDHSALYLWEKGVSAEILQIEPFTIEQAKDFIDKRLPEAALNAQYRVVRDHIINSVEGFFKNESEISKKESQAFIGYAPVLLSIVILLTKTKNFKALHEELIAKNDRGVELLLDIMSLILTRDREEKILPVLNEQLCDGRDKNFIDDIKGRAYNSEEQCLRILCYLLGQSPDIELTGDAGFNHQYEKLADIWLKEHPFIHGGKIQNAVFESYVVATLMQFDKYESLVLKYLQTRYKNAFMLFFIFEKLSKDKLIKPSFLQYIYASLKSLDDKSIFYGMDVIADQEAEGKNEVEVNIDFFNNVEERPIYKFSMMLPVKGSLPFSTKLANANINIPVNIQLKGKRVELKSPLMITCVNLELDTTEFVIEGKKNEDITIECDHFSVDYSSGQIPQLVNYMSDESDLLLFCDNKPEHPFLNFYNEGTPEYSTLSGDILEKYNRLRKILMQFRSHSKGELAKLKDKVEHPRILKNPMGWKVLTSLKSCGVVFEEAHLYKLNPNALHEFIGLTYLDLKKKSMNGKTIEFLESIE